MLTDAGALALSLVAIRLARRPAAGAMTYGLGRSEILAAAINGTTLLVLGLLFVYEGIRRLIDPPAVEGAAVLIVARARHRREPGRHAGAGGREPPSRSTSRAPSSTSSPTSRPSWRRRSPAP